MGGEYRSLRYLACGGGVGTRWPGAWARGRLHGSPDGGCRHAVPYRGGRWGSRRGSEGRTRSGARPSHLARDLRYGFPSSQQFRSWEAALAGPHPSRASGLPSWQRQCRGPGPAAHEPEGWSVGRQSSEYNRWTSIPESADKAGRRGEGVPALVRSSGSPGCGPHPTPGWSLCEAGHPGGSRRVLR